MDSEDKKTILVVDDEPAIRLGLAATLKRQGYSVITAEDGSDGILKATQTLPMGTAYAVWTGIGAVGTVIMGLLFFKEPATFLRLFFITTLVGSIIGLKWVSH